MNMKTRKKQNNYTPLQDRCLALNSAISKGVIVKANIRGTIQKLISIKQGEDGLVLLFRDEEENVVIFQVKPGKDAVELFVSLPLE